MTIEAVTEVRPAGDDVGRRALLVDIKQLAALLARSVASLERDQAAGRLPTPVYVGGSKRWRWAEVEAWEAARAAG